jgi:hypothetical protein
MRAIGSTVPPGGNGTIILMTPDGQVSAKAAMGALNGAAMAPSTSVRLVKFMVPLPRIFVIGASIQSSGAGRDRDCWPFRRKAL